MTGGVGEGRKRRAAVAWFVGGEEVFGRPGEEDGEPAEEENQKRGGRLLLKKKMGLGLGFFVFFMMLSKLPPLLKIQCSMVFIGKVLLGFQISPSTFLSFSFPLFFCKF
jgi:hypothetical protein